jgi:DNA-directed RNA polymerase I, II, and III subunit RPABC2
LDEEEEEEEEHEDENEEYDVGEDAEINGEVNPMEIDGSYGIDFSDDEVSDDEEEEKNGLQKFEKEMKHGVIIEHHPEIILKNHHEIEELCVVIRDENGVINDPNHRTIPFITKYEKAKLLGERAKQINAGATAFIEVDQSVIDGYLIALAEFEQKKIPMIIRRPLPNNRSEYWRLEDLEIL